MISEPMKIALIGAVAAIVAAVIVAIATVSAQSDSSTNPSPGPSVEAALPTESSSPEPGPPQDHSGIDASSAPAAPADIWVADMEPVVDIGFWGRGNTAKVRGKTYVHALQPSLTMTQGDVMSSQFALGGEYSRLSGLIGIVDGGHSSGKAIFEIMVDNVVVQQAELEIGSEPVAVDLPLVGANDLVLRATNISQSAYWAEPAFLDFQLHH